MKAQYLFIPLFVLSAVLLVDFMLVVAIGVFSSLLGASTFFYQIVFPYIIEAVVLSSIVLLAISISKKYLFKNSDSNSISTINSFGNSFLEKTA